MTRELAKLPALWYAADLSSVAVRRARNELRDTLQAACFFAARSTALPVRDHSFDLVVAADGLYSWDIPRQTRDVALQEIHRALSTGGHVIFTEHVRPQRFKEFTSEIEAAFTIERTLYFYDRPAYQFESWFKSFRSWRIAGSIRASTGVARALSAIGRLFGTRGARHICLIARRD